MMTSAMTKRVSTTPMRIPNTGVNSSGTGLSVEESNPMLSYVINERFSYHYVL